MQALMDLALKKEPSFGKNNVITMELASGNRMHSRIESLQHCLISKGYHYTIEPETKKGLKGLKLKPQGTGKVIVTFEHLEAILEICGFSMKIE